MGLFGRKDVVIFERHVAFTPDGRGATFRRILDRKGIERWSWTYDLGVPDNLQRMIATEMAVTLLEKELRLPLTWPMWDPDAPQETYTEPSDDERRASAEEALRSDPANLHAITRLWDLDGVVVQPEELVVGDVYSFGYDIGIYRRSFVGHMLDGYPEFADDPGDYDEWFAFESSQSTDGDGSRFSREDWTVKRISAPQVEAMRVFTGLREQHLARSRRRREY